MSTLVYSLWVHVRTVVHVYPMKNTIIEETACKERSCTRLNIIVHMYMYTKKHNNCPCTFNILILFFLNDVFIIQRPSRVEDTCTCVGTCRMCIILNISKRKGRGGGGGGGVLYRLFQHSCLTLHQTQMIQHPSSSSL